MLPSSEWLHLAERLPVGQSFRTKHICGAGDALQVANKDGAYTAWCHRCQEGGYVSKTHVRYRAPVLQEITRSTLPRSAIAFKEAGQAVQQHCYRFFLGKGIDPNMLPLQDMLWDDATHRVIFKHEHGASGRVVQDGVFPKWIEYYVNGKVATHAVFRGTSDAIVFTEDILSAIKYKYATGCSGVALLGTVLPSDVRLPSSARLFIALDGDKAGREGAACTRRALEFRGYKPVVITAPAGLDPKDLTIRQLRESLMNE